MGRLSDKPTELIIHRKPRAYQENAPAYIDPVGRESNHSEYISWLEKEMERREKERYSPDFSAKRIRDYGRITSRIGDLEKKRDNWIPSSASSAYNYAAGQAAYNFGSRLQSRKPGLGALTREEEQELISLKQQKAERDRGLNGYVAYAIDHYRDVQKDPEYEKQMRTDHSAASDPLSRYLRMDEKQRQNSMFSSYEGMYPTGYESHRDKEDDAAAERGYRGSWDQLKPEEINTYYTILQTKGQEAADTYLDDMQTVLNKRQYEIDAREHRKEFNEAGHGERFWMSAASVPQSLIGGSAQFLDDTVAGFQGKEINPYSKTGSWRRYGGDTREMQAEAFDEATGYNPETGEGTFMGISAGDLYGAGMSVADTLAGRALGSHLYGAMMGMGASAEEAKELYEKGATEDQIKWGAGLAGTAEMVFEDVSLDKIIHMKDPKSLGKLVLNALGQGFIEGSEEFTTEAANIITNWLVMQDKSDLVRIYEENGKDPKKTAMALGWQVAKAGILGAISGVPGGFVGSGAKYGEYHHEVRTTGKAINRTQAGTNAILNFAENISKDSSEGAQGNIREKADAYRKVLEQKNPSGHAANMAAGELRYAIKESISEMRQGELKTALVNKGFEEKAADDMAQALEDYAMSRTLSHKQEAKIKQGWKNQKVIEAVRSVLNNRNTASNQKARKLDRLTIAAATGNPDFSDYKSDAEAYAPSEKYNIKEPVEGKTADGETFTIASAGNGKMTLEIEDGEIVDSKDAAYPSVDLAIVFEAVGRVAPNVETANHMVQDYLNGDTPARVFAIGIQQGYDFGANGISSDELLTSELTKGLSPAQRATAYRAGQEGGVIIPTAQDGTTASRALPADYKGGTVNTDAILTKDEKKWNARQREGMTGLRMAAAASGAEVRVFESFMKDGKRLYIDPDTGKLALDKKGKPKRAPHGYYKNGRVYVDLNAGFNAEGAILFTVGHEFTHFMREWNPEKYREIADILIHYYGEQHMSVDEAVQGQMKKAKDDGRTLRYDEAMEEWVADSMQTILRDGKTLEFMAEVRQKDQGLWEKIKGWFAELRQKLKNIVSAYKDATPYTAEAQIVAQAKDLLEKIEPIFAQGLMEAGDNLQGRTVAENATTTKENLAVEEKATTEESTAVQEEAPEDIIPYSEQKKPAAKAKQEPAPKPAAGKRMVLDYQHAGKSFSSLQEGNGDFYVADDGTVTVAPEAIAKPNDARGWASSGFDYLYDIENTDSNNPLLSLQIDSAPIAKDNGFGAYKVTQKGKAKLVDWQGKNSTREDSTVTEVKEAMGPDLGEVQTNKQGELLLAENKNGSTMMYSPRTYADGGEAKLIAALKRNGFSQDDIDHVTEQIDSEIKWLEQLSKQLEDESNYTTLASRLGATITTDVRTGKQTISALVKNGEYPVNIDLTLICKKRVAYMNLMKRLLTDNVFSDIDYSGNAIAKVNQILRDSGFETACLGCFVESRRLQFQAWAETITSEWNEEVEKVRKGAGYFNFTDGGSGFTDEDVIAFSQEMDKGIQSGEIVLNDKGNQNLGTGAVQDKMARLIQSHPSLQKKLTVADILTPEGLKALRSHPDIFSLVKQRYGAASPKYIQDYNPYNEELAELSFGFIKATLAEGVKGSGEYRAAAAKDFKDDLKKIGDKPKQMKGESAIDFQARMAAYANAKEEYNQKVEDAAVRKYLYDIGGARIQSFSDFMIENVFDYIQIVADLAAKRMPMHGYTKEYVALRLFGMSGIKWNGSLIAHMDPNIKGKNAKKFAGLTLMPDGSYGITFDDYETFLKTKAAHEEDPKHNKRSFIQSIGWKDIVSMQLDPRYSANVGSITIGVSDEQIKYMLRSPLFRMVIPYHKSGMIPGYARLVGVDKYNDYTKYQTTTVYRYYDLNKNPLPMGKKLSDSKTDTSFMFNEAVQHHGGDAKAAAKEYVDWCRNELHEVYNKDSGKLIGYATYAPMFSNSPYGYDFTKEDNYYKLIEDFNVYNSVGEEIAKQGAVQMIFPGSQLTEEQQKAIGRSSTELSEQELQEYAQRLRDTGIFSEKEIQKYVDRANWDFHTIVEHELQGRIAYHKAQDPKWEATVKEIEDALLKAPGKKKSDDGGFHRAKGTEGTGKKTKNSKKVPYDARSAYPDRFPEQAKLSARDSEMVDSAIKEAADDGMNEIEAEEQVADVVNTLKFSGRDEPREETYSIIGKEPLYYPEGDEKPDLTLVEVYNDRTGKTETTIKNYGQKPKNYIPKKIAYCYKLFEQHPDGTLHALFAGASNATPIGEWVYAKGFPYTDSGVKGMNLRERYGWHLSAGLPSAPHLMSTKSFERGYPSKNAYGHPKGSKRVWVQMAYDASTDFNEIADQTNAGDIFGLIPFGGYYAFKENNQSEWVISSGVKIDHILTEDERQRILRDAGFDEYEAWRKKFRATDEEKAEAKARSKKRKSVLDIAKKRGVPKQVVLAELNSEMRNSIKSRIIDNPDIRYSQRDPREERTLAALQKQNAKLTDDVRDLKELLKLQGQVTGGTKLNPSSVYAAARNLMKNHNAEGDYHELSQYLTEFYDYLADENSSTSWGDVVDAAAPALQWLQTHQKEKPTKAVIEKLAEHQSWTEDIYDSFWKVKTLLTPADRGAAKLTAQKVKDKKSKDDAVAKVRAQRDARIKALTEKHKASMDQLRSEKNERIKQIREQAAADQKAIREQLKKEANERVDATAKRYQERIAKNTESRHATEVRHKLQKVVHTLDKLLRNPTKEKHVPIALQHPVSLLLDMLDVDTVGADAKIADIQKEIQQLRAKRTEYQTALAGADEKKAEKLRDHIEVKDREIAGAYQRIENLQARDEKMQTRLQELHAAYLKIQKDTDPYVSSSYDPVVDMLIEEAEAAVGYTPLSEMSLDQLTKVYHVYKALLKTVQDANKAHSERIRETIEALGSNVINEIRSIGYKEGAFSALKMLRKYGWQELRPTQFFKILGSPTLNMLWQELRAGEDTFAKDIAEAKDYRAEIARKYNAKSWDNDKLYTFTDAEGQKFQLNLQQIMSIYAYSRRGEQAMDHFAAGGITLGKDTKHKKKVLNIDFDFEPNSAAAYRLPADTVEEIVGKLTEDQAAYVRDMQHFLSSVMGEKGNEISRELYDINLFTEENYFPLRSASEWMARASSQEQMKASGFQQIKNKGMTKATVKHANNPVVLTGFDTTWASHVDEMSVYHSMTLPMEDFGKVFAYHSDYTEDSPEAVVASISKAYGQEPINYINELVRQINGGVKPDPNANIFSRGISKFKKTATVLSLSVIAQQHSAIYRAMAVIDPKYFATKVPMKDHAKAWEELKRYAPVAIIKEMGGFDTGTGGSAVDYILANEYGKGERAKALVSDTQYREDIMGRGPAYMDEVGWIHIWEAAKNQARANNPGKSHEEQMKAAANIFTRAATETQVYDSVMSRSGLMRSKDSLASMVTAFMAEPTVTVNMVADAIVAARRGNKTILKRTLGSIFLSTVANAAAAALVYAARDDDDDQTYVEKYAEAALGKIMEGLNPLTYLPIARDFMSLLQGYDIERSDMSVWADLAKAVQEVLSDKATPWQKVRDFSGSVASIFGLPLKNVLRDAQAIYNVFAINPGQTTGAGIKRSVEQAVIPSWASFFGYKPDSKDEILYDAVMSGNREEIRRAMRQYKTEEKAHAALRKQLKIHDDRIEKAAKLKLAGDAEGFKRTFKQIQREGNFSFDDIMSAINSVASELKPKSEPKAPNPKAEAFKKEYGYSWSNRGDLYLGGGISREELIEAYADIEEKSIEEATESVDAWIAKMELGAQYPDLEITTANAAAYLRIAEPAGIDIHTFMEYREQSRDLNKAEDMELIDSLPLSSRQKDALYLSHGSWSKKKLQEAPWH